jgi:hypothetical protein
MGSWLHHVHVWLDASTWHWAMAEIGGVVLLILILWGIVALARGGGGSSYSHSAAAAAQRSRADATMRGIGSDYNRVSTDMRQAADDWRNKR